MLDLKTALVARILEGLTTTLRSGAADDGPWGEARQVIDEVGERDPDLVAAIEARDLAGLRAILDQWASGTRPLPAQDRAVFKRAMQAYRKSFKVTRLDDESKVGGGPMSAGSASRIVAITPPAQYPREVWNALALQGRLVYAGQGMYALGRG